MDGVINWVIEAKPPSEEINVDTIEQAWSYANPAEVRAVYFALCNGRELHVHQTQLSPSAPALLKLDYAEFAENFSVLEGLLGPEAILRAHPVHVVDPRPPLGLGLRPVVRITHGLIRYYENSLGVPILTDMQITVKDGAIERDENGKLVALLPTAFSNRLRAVFPKGERLFDVATGARPVLENSLTCVVDVVATGVLSGHVFQGDIKVHGEYVELGLGFDSRGTFEMHLA